MATAREQRRRCGGHGSGGGGGGGSGGSGVGPVPRGKPPAISNNHAEYVATWASLGFALTALMLTKGRRRKP
jgi:cytochrome oxidase assembly protein ShyY1